MLIVDGKKITKEIAEELKSKIESLKTRLVLSVVSVGTTSAGESFVQRKKEFGEKIGAEVEVHHFDENIDEAVLKAEVSKIERASHGVVIQLPLPAHLDSRAILNLIPPDKDPDVLNSFARKEFVNCRDGISPPVAEAVAHILERENVSYKGKYIVILGKGKLVGSPVYSWFRCRGVMPRVFDETNNEEEIMSSLKKADIIVSGIGEPGFIKPEMISEGVVCIDAGTSEQAGKIKGDFDEACAKKAGLFTPVPGGVGPVTVAMLFKNFLSLIEEKL